MKKITLLFNAFLLFLVSFTAYAFPPIKLQSTVCAVPEGGIGYAVEMKNKSRPGQAANRFVITSLAEGTRKITAQTGDLIEYQIFVGSVEPFKSFFRNLLPKIGTFTVVAGNGNGRNEILLGGGLVLNGSMFNPWVRIISSC